MKPTKFIAGLTAFSFCATAYADVVVDITGATAFRAASLLAIRAKFNESGQPYKFAHDQATAGGTVYSGATRSIWIGTFPGVSGTTTIRTSFNGSVEGVRALVPSELPAANPTYYQPSLLNSTTAIVGGAELHAQGTTGAVAEQSEIAFSDVSKAATPYSGASLLPGNPAVGVVVFTMLTNEGSEINNVTSQQFRALLSNGFQPLSLFTGDPDDVTNVYATGRNDGSGTRTTYLAESGFGITNLVKQYVTNVSTATTLTQIQLVPAGGVNDSDPGTAGIQPFPGQLTGNRSTVWGQDVAGNGGYSSGSTLRTDMGKTGAAVDIMDEFGNITEEDVRADLVTWLSLNDAVTARNNGAVVCGYNGVKLADFAAGGADMSVTDRAKVTNGAYTAWSYQQMYRRADIVSGDTVTVYNGVRAAIQTNLGTAGIPITEMQVGREVDGGVVAP